MRYPKKLNIHGFAHTVILVGAVVLTGIIGSYLLILSHADSICPVSGPVSGAISGPTSGPSCQPTSGPVSGPSATLSCLVGGVSLQYSSDASVSPIVHIKNSGTATVKYTGITYDYSLGKVIAIPDTYVSVGNVGAGKTRAIKLPTVQTRSLTPGSYTINVYGSSGSGSFYCSQAFVVLSK